MGKYTAKKQEVVSFVKRRACESVSPKGIVAFSINACIALYTEFIATATFYTTAAFSGKWVGVFTGQFFTAIIVVAGILAVAIALYRKMQPDLVAGLFSIVVLLPLLRAAGNAVTKLRREGLLEDAAVRMIPRAQDFAAYPSVHTLAVHVLILAVSGMILQARFTGTA